MRAGVDQSGKQRRTEDGELLGERIRIAVGSIPGSQKGSAAWRSMNAKVIASENPADGERLPREPIARDAGSGGGCAASSDGKRTGRRSKP